MIIAMQFHREDDIIYIGKHICVYIHVYTHTHLEDEEEGHVQKNRG